MRRRGVIACISLVLIACGDDGGRTEAGSILDPRPDNAPDVVVLSVSGHDGAINGILCTSESNHAYLGEPGEAVEAVVAAIEDLGLTVAVAHFSDRISAPDLDGDGEPDNAEQFGFSELLDTMQAIHDVWIQGVAEPTKVVIVAHSHGATWAHIATSVMEHVPLSCLVTLDGICFAWECEHTDPLAAWVALNARQFSWDISRPCDAWTVASTLYNTKDVVFGSVLVNLEVQSADPFVSDCCDNVRLDGSIAGVATFTSGEDHNEVRDATGAAMTWVGDMIRLNGLP